MSESVPPVHDLAQVSFAGATRVELVGTLLGPAPLGTPLGGNALAFRTDVGFTVLERAKGDSNKRVSVFHWVQTERAAAPGLWMDVAGTRIELDPDALDLESVPQTSVPCQSPPVGFESVMQSRHAARGRLTRRDQRLANGDRVEFVGSIESTPGGGFRNVGRFVLHDLSVGGLTQRERRKRFTRGTILIIALAVLLAAAMIAVVFAARG